MTEALPTVALPAPLHLSSGGRLEHASVAYAAWGERRPDDAVVLLHGLSRSPQACTEAPPAPFALEGWANDLFGAGRPFDPAHHWVLCPNLLGSPFGSTSAASPEWDGKPFPELSVLDLADAVAAFLDAVGVARARAVVGFSLGGMVATALAARHPDRLRAAATLGGPARLPPAARKRLGLVATMLLADPEYRADGRAEGAARALRRVRVSVLRDLSPRDHALRDPFEKERALDAEAEAFARAYDPRCYLSLCRAMSTADLSTEALATVKARFLVAASSSDPLVPTASMQDTYHALTAAGARTRFFELGGEGGHHAFYGAGAAKELAFPLHDLIES